MQRHAALLGIGAVIDRAPYIDQNIGCSTLTAPELAATMPNFYNGIKYSVCYNLYTCAIFSFRILLF